MISPECREAQLRGGWEVSAETRGKLRAAALGRPKSESHRARIAEVNRRRAAELTETQRAGLYSG